MLCWMHCLVMQAASEVKPAEFDAIGGELAPKQWCGRMSDRRVRATAGLPARLKGLCF